jgi:hypothetical protein
LFKLWIELVVFTDTEIDEEFENDSDGGGEYYDEEEGYDVEEEDSVPYVSFLLDL